MHLWDSHHQLALYTLSHVILPIAWHKVVLLPGHFTDEGSRDTEMVESLPEVLQWMNSRDLYISLQQPRTDFYTGIRYSAPPPTNKNRREQNKTIAFLHLTCQEGARHYSWRVKNLFCFCVKGRSVQVVSVSELSFLWKWPSYEIHCRHLV